MSERLRTVVVGFGQIAAGLVQDARMARWFRYATHAQVLCEHPAFDWRGVADPTAAARESARAWIGIPAVASVAELAPCEPEVAVITAPPAARLDILEALPTLRAVLVEKPLSVGDDAGERFLAACAERDILVQVNFWRRADPLYRALGEGGLARRVGDLQTAFATYGNGLFNNGGHMVDFVRMLLGEVAAVQATGPIGPAHGPFAADLHVPFTLILEGGRSVAVSPLDFRAYREVGLDVWGTRGRLSLYQEGLGIFHYPLTENRGLENAREIASDAPTSLTPTVGDALWAMYDNLAAAIRQRVPLWSGGESARRTEATLEAVVQSARNDGRRIALDR